MINKLAIIYKICINTNYKTYVFVGHTFNLEKTQIDILNKLKNNEHENIKLQKLYNSVMREADPQHLGLYFRFETLQALRAEYYPTNILSLVMEQLEKSFIETIRADLKMKNKEDLLLNM